MTVMQGVPYTKEKIQRRFHRLLVTGSHEPLRHQIGDGVGLIECRADPQRGMVITQSSRTFFDVGFHQVHGVGERGVSRTTLGNLLSYKSAAPPCSKAAMAYFFLKPLKK